MQDGVRSEACPPAPLGDDKPKEECGVFGVYGPEEEVSRLAYFGLFALQHRGQESAGIAVTDGRKLSVHKRMGLVTQVFDEEILGSLQGVGAIGHTRYSTTGSSVVRNAQPVVVQSPHGDVAVAHNGNLLNTLKLRYQLEAEGVFFETTNDSEVIAKLIASRYRGNVEAAVIGAMSELHGAYSLTILTPDCLVGVKDPYGLRPLCLGRLPSGRYVLASESCALHVVGAEFVRELEPGEIVVIDGEGLREIQGRVEAQRALCVFEFIYLARPDSMMYGRSLHMARRRMGQELSSEKPVPSGEIVIPVPDTGTPAAIGFAEASRIPFAEGMIKSRYIHRTFIQPDQRMRSLGARMKYTPLREVLAGKNVVMVDDSIVRGTTTGKIVRMLFEAGAAEVHVRITSPPVRWPCFYGIDMAERNQLIAHRMSVKEIEKHIGATSLGYLSLGGLMRAIGLPKEKFCTACLSGEYPIELPSDLALDKLALEPA